MEKKYVDFAVKKATEILAIDSPTGFTQMASKWLFTELQSLGFKPEMTKKGGVLVCFGGSNNPMMLTAHIDTLGGMVKEIKDNGRLKLTNLGGMRAENGECENVRVYTRNGKIIEGTFNIENPSVHVNLEYGKTERNFNTCEVILDEDVKCIEDVKKLGIDVGDIVCFEPRTKVTDSGYIKSRFLDDKLSVGIILGFAKYIKDNNINLSRKIYAHFTVYEEVGHGCSASCPSDVEEILSVDMGCVGEGVTCTEKEVSICAKDSNGPYNYEVVSNLINIAKANGIKYAVDVYPGYGSDVEATLTAGADIKHGLIGAGVYASHGYERGHIDGIDNALGLLVKYIV